MPACKRRLVLTLNYAAFLRDFGGETAMKTGGMEASKKEALAKLEGGLEEAEDKIDDISEEEWEKVKPIIEIIKENINKWNTEDREEKKKKEDAEKARLKAAEENKEGN